MYKVTPGRVEPNTYNPFVAAKATWATPLIVMAYKMKILKIELNHRGEIRI